MQSAASNSWLQIPYVYGKYEVVFSREVKQQLLDFIHEQFTKRNRLTRLAIELCLDRPRFSRAVQSIAKRAADISYRGGAFGQRAAQAAYSAIFNLRYYQGVADELGGRKIFFGGAKSHAIDKSASS